MMNDIPIASSETMLSVNDLRKLSDCLLENNTLPTSLIVETPIVNVGELENLKHLLAFGVKVYIKAIDDPVNDNLKLKCNIKK